MASMVCCCESGDGSGMMGVFACRHFGLCRCCCLPVCFLVVICFGVLVVSQLLMLMCCGLFMEPLLHVWFVGLGGH